MGDQEPVHLLRKIVSLENYSHDASSGSDELLPNPRQDFSLP